MVRLPAAYVVAAAAVIVSQASLPAPAAGQQAIRQLPAARGTGAIDLDGVLEEPAWAEAPMVNNFIQNDPREGEPATFDTDVRVLYDDDALYFGVFARDGEPDRLIVNDIKKDFDTANSDGFRIILDTFRDERNGYTFATNPAGAKWDAQMVSEGREVNANWDGIWDVATRVTDAGWHAEIRIPFRTLKFNNDDTQSWGLNFERKLRRLNENSYWSPLPRIYDLNRVSLAGTMDDLRGLRPGMNLRFKPYVSSSSNTLQGRRTTGDFDGGLDVKYGVTSGLVWDFTVNTDFSQAEADEQQINLTRFSLFFPEKREFFLENSGIFQFGPGGRDGGLSGGSARQEMRMFFTRRIGLSEAGDPIPILAGTRLTGRQGEYALGVLNIQQREQNGQPGANFTALRLRRNIGANSDIGAILLSKEQRGSHDNRVAGFDANARVGRYLTLNGFATRSFAPQSMLPDNGNAYSTRTFIEYQSPTWQSQAGYGGIGKQFTDEMGYVPRTGTHNFDARIGPRLRPAAVSKWIRQMQPHWEFDLFTRQDNGRVETSYHGYHMMMTFQNGSSTEMGANAQVEDIPAPFIINSARGIRVNPGRHEFTEYFIYWNTISSAAPAGMTGRVGVGKFYDGYIRAYRAGPALKLNEHFNANVNLVINDVSLPGGSFVSTLMTAYVNYNFNTRMFFNALVQYNTDSHQWSSNLRFNVIHRPLSDVYLVYNERRDELTGRMLSRAVIAKVTYLLAF